MRLTMDDLEEAELCETSLTIIKNTLPADHDYAPRDLVEAWLFHTDDFDKVWNLGYAYTCLVIEDIIDYDQNLAAAIRTIMFEYIPGWLMELPDRFGRQITPDNHYEVEDHIRDILGMYINLKDASEKNEEHQKLKHKVDVTRKMYLMMYKEDIEDITNALWDYLDLIIEDKKRLDFEKETIRERIINLIIESVENAERTPGSKKRLLQKIFHTQGDPRFSVWERAGFFQIIQPQGDGSVHYGIAGKIDESYTTFVSDGIGYGVPDLFEPETVQEWIEVDPWTFAMASNAFRHWKKGARYTPLTLADIGIIDTTGEPA